MTKNYGGEETHLGDDVSEQEELGHLFLTDLNDLARCLCLEMGWEGPRGFQFHESGNPRAVMFFNMAIIAHSFIKDDPDLLKFRIYDRKFDYKKMKAKDYLSRDILKALDYKSNLPRDPNGLLIREIINFLKNNKPDLKVSRNTVVDSLDDLIEEGKVVCTNPEKLRNKRYKLKKEGC